MKLRDAMVDGPKYLKRGHRLNAIASLMQMALYIFQSLL